jgi:hypothetical protein
MRQRWVVTRSVLVSQNLTVWSRLPLTSGAPVGAKSQPIDGTDELPP